MLKELYDDVQVRHRGESITLPKPEVFTSAGALDYCAAKSDLPVASIREAGTKREPKTILRCREYLNITNPSNPEKLPSHGYRSRSCPTMTALAGCAPGGSSGAIQAFRPARITADIRPS